MTDTTCETCSKSSVCKFIDDFRQTEEQAQNLTRNSRLTPIEVHVGCKEYSEYPLTVHMDTQAVADIMTSQPITRTAKAVAFDGIGG